MPGNRVSVEFRNNVSNRRKHESRGDDLSDRFGYRISINPIYAETYYSSDFLFNSSNKKSKQQRSKNKDLGSWITLLNQLVHGASVMSQTLIKGSEGEKTQVKG